MNMVGLASKHAPCMSQLRVYCNCTDEWLHLFDRFSHMTYSNRLKWREHTVAQGMPLTWTSHYEGNNCFFNCELMDLNLKFVEIVYHDWKVSKSIASNRLGNKLSGMRILEGKLFFLLIICFWLPIISLSK